jgi:hypothetical protein
MIEKIAFPAMISGWRARREGRFGSGMYSGSSAARGLRGATRFVPPKSAASDWPASAVMSTRGLLHAG